MAKAQVRDFLADRKELTLGDEGDDDPLTVVYRPGRVNSEFMRSLSELGDDPQADAKVLVFIIGTLVSDWNLTGPLVVDEPIIRKGKPLKDEYGIVQYETRKLVEDGEKIPVKADYIKHLPSALLGFIWRGITEDMKPDPKSETTS
jgi:hypothetical protein